VIVNCGGRTRSIIGAQSLINAGVPNKVVSLKNGTQAWHLAGYEILKGSTARPPAVSPRGHAFARAAAEQVAQRFGVARIDAATLARWQDESRTLYVFDVRDPDEYAAGHVPGMKNVPGGQLVQETDRHAATWGARVVLVDDDAVRAVMTAHWMKQMGWDAAAMTVDMKASGKETGPWRPRVLGLDAASIASIDAAALRARMQSGGVSVIDVDFSRDYRDGHIPGAWFGLRSRLDAILPQMPAADTIVFTSSDGVLARLAAADASRMTKAPVLALEGGTAAWREAGFPLERGATRLATAPDDIRLRAREQEGGVEDAMRAYLSWEIALAEQMAQDDDKRFGIISG
jgi:rhodanese-related sulfurtransferase